MLCTGYEFPCVRNTGSEREGANWMMNITSYELGRAHLVHLADEWDWDRGGNPTRLLHNCLMITMSLIARLGYILLAFLIISALGSGLLFRVFRRCLWGSELSTAWRDYQLILLISNPDCSLICYC
jgi:hypothetical protein